MEIFNISIPYISSKNKNDVLTSLNNESVSTYGHEVELFEKALKQISFFKYSIGTNSGTSSLELIFKVGLAKNKKSKPLVAISDYTFIATSNAVINSGSDVCLIPCEENFSMSCEFLEKAIQKNNGKNRRKIDAILLTLPMGNIVESIEKISNISKKFNIPLVIDAASSIGIDFKLLHRMCPNIWALILSFNGNKVITAGAGGVILTKDKKLEVAIREQISLHRRSNYHHKDIGENKKMPAICASLGLSQLEELKWRLKERKSVFDLYENFLGESKLGEHFKFSNENALSHSYWIAGIIPKTKSIRKINMYRQKLRDLGIISPPFWKKISSQKEYAKFVRFNLSSLDYDVPEYIQLPSSYKINKKSLLSKLIKFEKEI